MIRTVRWVAAAALIAAALPAWAAGNAEAGRIKANTCMGCHGIPNYNNVYPTYRVPKLGGQSADYLASALRAGATLVLVARFATHSVRMRPRSFGSRPGPAPIIEAPV